MEIEITPKLIAELSEGFIQTAELIAKRVIEITKEIKSQKGIYSIQEINELEKNSQKGINFLIRSSNYIDVLKELLEKINSKDKYAENKREDLSMILQYQTSLHQMMNRIIVDNNSLLEEMVRLGNAIDIKHDSLN